MCGDSEVVETEGVGEEVILVSVVGVAVPVVMINLVHQARLIFQLGEVRGGAQGKSPTTYSNST